MFRFTTRDVLWLILVAGLGSLLCARQIRADDRAEIETVLSSQAAAWNRGDIDAFMEHYWKSDELTFSSRGQTTRGWTRTKENYERRYPTREQMGQLKFTQLEITSLADSAALVLGRWQLMREQSPVEGNFTLILRRLDDKWVIIHDHTSRADTP